MIINYLEKMDAINKLSKLEILFLQLEEQNILKNEDQNKSIEEILSMLKGKAIDLRNNMSRQKNEKDVDHQTHIQSEFNNSRQVPSREIENNGPRHPESME